MKYDSFKHHRKSIRLKEYDYSSPGAYFVTICTKDRAEIFGNVVDGKMILNELGEIVNRCWLEIPTHFPHAHLDEFVIMPNHMHGIIEIQTEIMEIVGASLLALNRRMIIFIGRGNRAPTGTENKSDRHWVKS